MVASSSPQASLFGLRMLAAGGSAADAALAAAAGMQVTMPCQTGLGGDCFVLYYEAASGTVHALNGSGRSARGLSLELLRREGLATALPAGHAHNVTVPGAPAAWADLHARFGRLVPRAGGGSRPPSWPPAGTRWLPSARACGRPRPASSWRRATAPSCSPCRGAPPVPVR